MKTTINLYCIAQLSKKAILGILLSIFVCGNLSATTKSNFSNCKLKAIAKEKLTIKIKNDSGNEISVINAGTGRSYKLIKNVITTIKMEQGEKLYIYEKGKKGKLLLTATKELDDKLQLFSSF